MNENLKNKHRNEIKVSYFGYGDINDCQVKIDLALIWQKQHKVLCFVIIHFIYFVSCFYKPSYILFTKYFKRGNLI